MTYITQKGGDERKILYLMNQMKKREQERKEDSDAGQV